MRTGTKIILGLLGLPLVAVFIGALVSGPSPSTPAAEQAAPVQPVAPDDGEQAFAKSRELVKLQLRDPDSAQFWGNYWIYRIDGVAAYVCGMVNTKNAFGGYVGYQYYMAAVGELHTGKVIIGASPEIAKSWCNAAVPDAPQ